MSNAITPTPAETERHPVPPAPIHPLAALATIVLDNVFGWFEILDPLALVLTCVTVGGIAFLTTMFVQRYLAKDEWGPSVAKGMVMGVLAGVPFPVAGTAVGAVLLGWAGMNQWIKLPTRRGPEQFPASEEIVEAESKEIE